MFLRIVFCDRICLYLGQVKRQTPQSDTNAFLEGVGDLVTGLISTGLRSVAALITSGGEATQKMAVVNNFYSHELCKVLSRHVLNFCQTKAVGTAALPPLLNVTRAFTRVQQTSTRLFNSTASQSALLPERGVLRDVTRV